MAPSSCRSGRDAERGAELGLALEDAEEQRAEAGVLGGEEQRHHGHRRVDRPVRRRPRRGRAAEPACRLVRLRVAVEVRLRVGERQGDHRRVEQAGEGEAAALVGRERDVPEPRRLVARQHDEVPALGLAGAGCARGEVDELVEQLVRDRIGPERPRHPPPADDVGEVAQVRAPSLTRSSAIVQP